MKKKERTADGMDRFLEFLKVLFLGIVEGITEWLPVSSTGHMLIFDAFNHASGVSIYHHCSNSGIRIAHH